MLASTLDSRQGFACATTTKLNLYKWRNTSSVCCFDFHRYGGIYRGPRWVTNLVKSVTCQVMACRPSQVAGPPWSSASTDLQLGIPLYRLLESVTLKPTYERLQGWAGRTGGLVSRPPPRPTGQWPMHAASSC
jgi:hypothetical protein